MHICLVCLVCNCIALLPLLYDPGSQKQHVDPLLPSSGVQQQSRCPAEITVFLCSPCYTSQSSTILHALSCPESRHDTPTHGAGKVGGSGPSRCSGYPAQFVPASSAGPEPRCWQGGGGSWRAGGVGTRCWRWGRWGMGFRRWRIGLEVRQGKGGRELWWGRKVADRRRGRRRLELGWLEPGPERWRIWEAAGAWQSDWS